ncbi:MAG: IPT/TIG domain-containing protein [Planctomycetes bacterium]|nr:IPT/TIG domain-containing protein [Planctomycetota bacterium]
MSVRLSKRLVHFGASLGCVFAAFALAGFVQIQFTPGSSGFKWPTTSVRYVIQQNGTDDVADKSDEAAIRLALRAWEQVPDSFVVFSEDTFADASRTDYTATDIHLIMWDEDGSSGLFPPGSNVIALTPILASTNDGTILDGDIIFNGELRFTTDPIQEANRFDVQAVATHEIGHLLGFDHSGGTFSTMFASIPSGSTYSRSLGGDDAAGAATLYGTGASSRGTVQGTITITGGGTVAYPQVVAVNQLTGAIGGQALGDSTGNYLIAGLLPGTYDLYAEPVNGPYGLADTIGFKNESSTGFKTTYNVGNPLTVNAGQTQSASWSVPTGAPTLNVTATAGSQISVGDTSAIALVGTGLDKVTGGTVSGTGIVVQSISSQTAGGMVVTLAAKAGAITGIRCLTLDTATGELIVVTAAVSVVQRFPVVSLVSPTELQAQGGQTVTITGSRFVDGSQVVIGGQLATGIFVAADGTSLTCVAPPSPGTTEALDVVVIRPDGREARLRDVLFYEAAPVPTSVDPNLGPAAGGTIHTVHGGGFTAPLAVFFDGIEAEVLTVTADQISIRLPAHAPGPVDVRVVAEGKIGLLPNGLNYIDGSAPVIESLSPQNGGTGGGTTVTIRGSGFESTSEVRFGGALAALSSVRDDEIVVATVAHAAGQVEVRVLNPSTGLSGVSPTPFNYDDTPPPPPAGGGGSSSDCRLGSADGSGISLLLLMSLLLLARVGTPPRAGL